MRQDPRNIRRGRGRDLADSNCGSFGRVERYCSSLRICCPHQQWHCPPPSGLREQLHHGLRRATQRRLPSAVDHRKANRCQHLTRRAVRSPTAVSIIHNPGTQQGNEALLCLHRLVEFRWCSTLPPNGAWDSMEPTWSLTIITHRRLKWYPSKAKE